MTSHEFDLVAVATSDGLGHMRNPLFRTKTLCSKLVQEGTSVGTTLCKDCLQNSRNYVYSSKRTNLG